MEPSIIKTEKQYQRYLAEVERLASEDPKADSSDGRRLELLAMLVEDYERSRFVFDKPDPIDAILFRMEQQGLRQKDIAPLVGGKNRASEVLSRKRPLTLPMIRALHEQLDIPSQLLIREPEPTYGAATPSKREPKRADVKRRYARIHLDELREYPRGTKSDDWEKGHQESFFYHLAGSVEALLHEINDGYDLRLNPCDVKWHIIKDRLSGQQSPAYDQLVRLKNDQRHWLCLLFELRHQGAHREANPRMVNLSNTKVLDNYFIDPRDPHRASALVINGRRECLKVLEYLYDKAGELIEDLRRLDPKLA